MSIMQRVAALESSARRWRVAAVVMGCGLLASMGLGADKPPVQDRVFTKSLVIVNDNNQVVGTLSGQANGASLIIIPPGQKAGAGPTFSASATADGARLVVANGGGQDITLLSQPKIGSLVQVKDGKGQTIGIFGNAAGASFVTESPNKSRVTIAAPDDGGNVLIDVSGSDGKSVWSPSFVK